MALDLTTITPPTPPKRQSVAASLRGFLLGSLVFLVGGAALASWKAGLSLDRVWKSPPTRLRTLKVFDGPLAVVVVETGTVESASNTSVKCQVEALAGVVGGSSSSSSKSSSSTTTPTTAAATLTMTPSTSKSASAKAAASKAAQKATSKSSMSTDASAGGAAGGMGGSGGSASGSSKSGSAVTMTVTQRPTIRSFSFTVTPYTSLQPKRASVSTVKSSGGGGGGGGGGGRGGGGGGNSEKQGSTRIIMIREEGDSVSKGDIVCEFDSAAFRDGVLAQRIKADSARSAKVQAESILEVNQIALREYRDGIFPQDLQLIRQYLSTCRTEMDRATRNRNWSQETLDKGFRAPQQHQADVLSVQRAEIALVVAELMEKRLIESTGPKLVKALEAKLEANREDVLSLESAYRIEESRLKRLEKMVANCTLRAPHDGTVVYALPPSNGWRPATPAIMEGATVREGQPIFELPDPKNMRIRAKINESKVMAIHSGQPASVRIDAFPDRILLGTVGEVTLIPAPASGPGSDVRIYFANIKLTSGNFEGLKPGLSAQVSFLVDDRTGITQIPITSIRWVGDTAFAAVETQSAQFSYRWQQLELGKSNTSFAEVVHGLKPGEQIVARPAQLPTPVLTAPDVSGPRLRAARSGPATPRG